MSTNLESEVRALLQARKGDWKSIAEQSGTSYSWVSKFMNGHIPNPGFRTLSDLHAYLSCENASHGRRRPEPARAE